MTLDEPSELQHGREDCAACPAYHVFIVLRDVRIDNRLRGTLRTGEFVGHGISQPLYLRPVSDFANHLTDKAVKGSRLRERRGAIGS